MNVHVPLSVRPPAARFTATDYLRMLDAGAFEDMKVELIDGELWKMSPAHSLHGRRHMQVAGELYRCLTGTTMEAMLDIATILADQTVCGPDIGVFTSEAARTGPQTAEHLLLAVEISDSTLDQDLDLKAPLYAAAQVPILWVVDVRAEITHVMTDPDGHGYRTRRTIPFAQALPVPGTEKSITLA
ncbi:Uma2 family endonuclease [Sandaracinobacteroides saxicola]|uniref:Uma2 family endonuclease n=1 Tax=Sandaracinobacteroides saxicola TaxID=2759707 RepID=A0A7G5IFU4_9SPHN|nr:Uma2 family endonuclease [Sandaracinobacteroides saxicola]QMW22236.1 Uma2 family endonuclease [Sandaracinobacteroides saxicola]